MSIENRVKAFNNSSFSKKSYTVEEVINILGVTRQSIYKLIKENCFKAVKVETGYRIIKDSFDDWLDGMKGVA